MIDVALLEGDFRVKKVINDNGLQSYDLDLEENNISDVLIKALRTPLGYLKLSVIQNLSVSTVDADYGNDLYELLSAPLNFNWYTAIRVKVLNTIAALNIDQLFVKDMNIQLAATDLVIVSLVYVYNGNENSVVINL